MSLEIDPTQCKLSFSELMSKFEEQPDGRKKLLIEIKKRIDYVKSFEQLYNGAVDFHRELSSIKCISDIITTNWDDFFEVECGAVPFVIADDIAYWDISERRVLKIHGSINNLGTIIASQKDYKKCKKDLQEGVLGSFLKTICTTKTVVFCGYSLSDEDFNSIYSFLKQELGELLPHSYIITLDKDIDKKIDTKKMTPIITNASFFIYKIKQLLIESNALIDSDIYNSVYSANDIINCIHSEYLTKFKISENYNLLYTYMYQDGLTDCFQRAIKLKPSGIYLCINYIFKQKKLYEQLRKEKVHMKKYDDVAYIDGYLTGLIFFLLGDDIRMEFPKYYIYGYKERVFEIEEFEKIIKSKKIYHKSAYKLAEKIISRNPYSSPNIIRKHTAFLL